jgi:hypothetical protein
LALPAIRYQPNPDYREFLDRLRLTKRELHDATIAELMLDHSPELIELLRQRAREKRKAIAAVLRPEIRLRADARRNGCRYSVLGKRRHA